MKVQDPLKLNDPSCFTRTGNTPTMMKGMSNMHEEDAHDDSVIAMETSNQIHGSQDEGGCAASYARRVARLKAQDGLILMHPHTVTAQQQSDTDKEEAGGAGGGETLTAAESDRRQEKKQQVERRVQSHMGIPASGSMQDGDSHLNGHDNATCLGSVAEGGGDRRC